MPRAARRRQAALALALLAATVAVVDRAAADDGLHATGRVPSAGPGPALALALAAGYGYSGVVLDSRDAHHRVGGGLAVAWRARRWLELGLDLRGRYDQHTGDEPDDGLVGDPRVWLRAGRSVAPDTWLGARLGVWLPGGAAPSIQLDATTVDVAGLFTWAPAATRVSALVGFRLDRSRDAIDPTTLSRPDRVGLGWSDENQVLVGVEVARRLGRWQPRAELSGELRVGGGSSASAAEDAMVGVLASPMRLELGVRRGLTSSMTLEAAIDLGLSQRPPADALAGAALIAIEPRLAATVGLAWHQARSARRVPIVVAEPAPVAEPPPVVEPPPPPPFTGALRGRVVDEEGAPLPGATVRVGERTVVTGDDGTFVVDGLPPGEVEATIERPGHQPLRRSFTVVAGPDAAAPDAAAPIDVVLDRIHPPSQIRGVIRGFDGQGLAATVRVEPLGLEVVAGADGRFTVDVAPGAYRLVVTLAGFDSQTRQVTVEVEGVAMPNLELRKARR